jgi:FSR family fosmidomycin resistance protein-like MFS transporter
VKHKANSILLTFVGAHIVNDFYVTVLPAFLPALADEFGLDYTELGVLSFAFTLLSGVMQPAIGHHADRRGKRRAVVAFGFMMGAAGFVSMAASPNFWLIVAVSSLCGLGGATYHPQATAFIVEAYPADRGRMLGIHGWGGSVGHFLAPAVVTLSIAAFDWRTSMVAIAVPLVLTSVLLRSTLEETVPNPAARLKGALSVQLLLVAGTFGLLSVVLRSFLTFSVKMLVDEGWENTSAGAALTVILLVGAIAQPVGGRLFDRIGGRTVFVGASVGTALSVGLFVLSSGALSLVAIGCIAFFGFALFPVSLALASQLAHSGQTGAAVGIIFGMSGLMSAAAQPVVGALGENFGSIRSALGSLIVVTVVAVPMALNIDKGHVSVEL